MQVRTEDALATEPEPEKLDLSLKEGQTIKVNINLPGRKGGRERSRSPGVQAGGGLAAPPKPSVMADAVAAAGIQVKEPRLAAPPQKQANPNWIQF